MDAIPCVLYRTKTLADELRLTVRTIERRIGRGELMGLTQRPGGIAWVAVPMDATPERLYELEDQVESLEQENSLLAHRHSRCESLLADKQDELREERARVHVLGRRNQELNEQVKHGAAATQAAEDRADICEREKAQLMSERDAKVLQMADDHQRELDEQQQKFEGCLKRSLESGNRQYRDFIEQQRQLERQTKVRTWAGLLIGAVICATIMIASVFLLG